MIKYQIKKNVRALSRQINRFRVSGKTKYFCIGRNKTGTTSLKCAFEDLGYIVGQQLYAEQLYDEDFFKKDFRRILRYCETGQVFQDLPFSLKETLPHIDKAFPNSKFILTTRDSTEQWYNSITKFHGKKFGRNGAIPSYSDLQNASYVRKGFMANLVRAHGTSPDDPYNYEIMCRHYEEHNQYVRSYFHQREEDFLEINLSDTGAYLRFIKFIGAESPYKEFPWKNKT